MALKSNFEDSNVISSPFVDEVANPGRAGVPGQTNEEVERQAIRVNELRQSHSKEAQDKLKAASSPSKTKTKPKENEQARARQQRGGNAAIVEALLNNQ